MKIETIQTTFTDAEFIRALKSENFLRIKDIEEKNKRLERIAIYLEGITCPKK